jgi:predicted ATPase/class 3 adenylate cyclase/DNA-binding CsgD family transcriptional regulator
MAEPRTRTVTFLLTDVEESTPLWEQSPAAMRQALGRHDAIIADGVAEHGGVVVKSRGEGDSIFAVFEAAREAVAASVALQSRLQAVAWPTPTALRVRMALATGEAEWRDGDYFGPVVNRCARMRAAAHGGQILAAQATVDLVHEALPDGVTLRDLGEHRFRGLTRPEPIFQIVHPTLPAEFPPLRSLDVHANNLPRQLTSFVGREHEIADVSRLLATTRLLTLTGSGGVGKTRLALRVAEESIERFRDGVWLVELAALGDPALVPQAVATVLGIREQPGRALQDTLIDVLRPRLSLIVIDNCEHLIAACASLAESLLRGCPGLTLLTTSREPLTVAGETVWRVPPLTLPMVEQDAVNGGGVLTLVQSEAVRLFVERARAAFPSFALTERNAMAVAQICRRLDGIPLAVELAAARVRGIAPEQLAVRLDHHLRLLTGGSRTALPRHQTARALVDWSHQLLTEPERVLFRRLSVFAGGWTLEAVEIVCSGTGIEPDDVLGLLLQLVDRSLVLAEEQPDSDGVAVETRYRLLETLRQYAAEKLHDAEEAAATRERHIAWALNLVGGAGAVLLGSSDAALARRLEAEHDNLRAALRWSLLEDAPTPTRLSGQRLAGALWRFWWMRSHLTEGSHWLETALAIVETGDEAGRHARATVVVGSSMLALTLRDYERTVARSNEALTLLGSAGAPALRSLALGMLAIGIEARGDFDRAQELFEQSLAIAREAEIVWLVGWMLGLLGRAAMLHGESERATALLEESLEHLERCGDRQGASWSLQYLGTVAERHGEHERAIGLFEAGLAASRDAGDKQGVAWALGNLGRLLRTVGAYGRATAMLGESLFVCRAIGDQWGVAWALGNLGRVALAQHDYQRATALFEENLVLCRDLAGRERRVPYALHYLGVVALELGHTERAARLFGAADAVRERVGRPPSPQDLAEHERQLAGLRRALGAERFATAWDGGRALSIDQAIEYALTAPTVPRIPAQPLPPAVPAAPARSASDALAASLSMREREVAALVARGYTNRQIADTLVISERTASTHVTHILNKLGFTGRSQVAVWAVEHGLRTD